MSEFDDWIGRSTTVTDVIEPLRTNTLAVALGGEAKSSNGDPLPLLHHWLYFWDVRPPAGLGPDGHPAKGGFLPPVPLPRRMWAGGRLAFHRPLLIGQTVRKTSTIAAIREKDGRSGRLVFVTVRHEFDAGEGVAIAEEQDLVYREASTAPVPLPQPAPPPPADFGARIDPGPVLLFRYSALTMNGHRIHYDLPYARDEESYPGLVVHGPLQATLLIAQAAASLEAPITGFAFRGESPAFAGLPLHVCGTRTASGAEVWTQQGAVRAMTGTVTTG